MKFFDTHAHYYDERFAEEASVPVDTLINTLMAGDVPYIINVGTSPSTSRMAIAQAAAHPGMYTAVGIHPTDCQTIADPDAALAEIEELICDKSSKCVCLGEIGLDYHENEVSREIQKIWFERQLRLAEKLDLPVAIHMRDSTADTLEILKNYSVKTGVLHCFSGSCETAEIALKMGFYISFSGTVTFKNAKNVAEAAKIVPDDRILIETDCPYLAPVPNRGKRNSSLFLPDTIRFLANLRSTPYDEMCRITYDNACRVFGINE